MGFSPYQDPLLVGKSGLGVERFVDFHLHVKNLIRYHVPSHHTPIMVPVTEHTMMKSVLCISQCLTLNMKHLF